MSCPEMGVAEALVRATELMLFMDVYRVVKVTIYSVYTIYRRRVKRCEALERGVPGGGGGGAKKGRDCK